MNVDIEVKKVELKGTEEKPWVLIAATNGSTFSVWPDVKNKTLFESARALKPGMHAVLDYKQNGDYRNVNSIVVSQAVEGVEVMQSQKPFLNESKENRISFLACNNTAKDVLGIVLLNFERVPGKTVEEKYDFCMQMVQTASKGLMKVIQEETRGGV